MKNFVLTNYPKRQHQQRGITLIAVLVILLLSLMAVMGAFRVTNLNEAMLGSTTDYDKAREAAEALIRDAELDINGRRPPYTQINADRSYGLPCRPDPATSTTSLVVAAGYIGCRNQATANTPWFPTNSEDFDAVSDIVTANSVTQRCKEGICVPLTMADHADIENNLAAMSPLGAVYGQFTRNLVAAGGYDLPIAVSGNPILNCPVGATSTSNPTNCGWYWVELFRYNTDAVNSGAVAAASAVPDTQKPFAYRITAIAQGLKLGTRVVLTSVFVPYPKMP